MLEQSACPRHNHAASAPALDELAPLRQQITGFHEELGFAEYNLREARDIIEAGGDYKRAGLPMKVALFAHQQIVIDAVWPKVASWIEQNPSSAGLMNIAPFRGYLSKQYLGTAGEPIDCANIDKNIRPLNEAEILGLKSRLKDQKEAVIVEAISQAVSQSFQVLLLQHELKIKNGSVPFCSSNEKVNLYEQLKNIMVEEQALFLVQSGQMKLKDGKKFVREQFGKLPLTLIIGEAAKVASEISIILPAETAHHAAVPAFALLHQAYVRSLINQFTITSRTEEAANFSSRQLFADSITEIKKPGCPYKPHIDKLLAERAYNSSMSPVVAGCPAVGTQALMGIVKWTAQVKKLLVES